MPAAFLSSEIASLVHHVELNKSGWWDRGTQRFILATIWLAARNLTASEIADELSRLFFLASNVARVRQQADALCVEGTLVCLPGGSSKISEQARKEFEKTIEEAEQLVEAAKKKFVDIFTRECPSVAADKAWRSFNEDLLMPLVREVGAKSYELISGAKLQLDRTIRFPEYLNRFPAEARQAARKAVLAYLDPADLEVRSYVLRHLSAYFLLEAGNLAKETLESLAKVTEKPPMFNIFLDTNFLFSILGLHNNPSNEAARSLMQLITELPKSIRSKLYVLRCTIDEARGVLGVQKDILRGVRITSNIADAMSEVELTGIAQRFVEASRQAGHPISADDYFDPYLNNLIAILRSKDIERFNQSVDEYRMKQEVLDSLLDQLDFEKQKFGNRARTYEQLLHDVVLWYFVRDKRPAQVESPLEASYWVVTVDYHFLGFDAFRRRSIAKQPPICVHPTALIQMLQFWLPRTPQFEKAVLESLRWPFLFQDFDPQAEKTIIRILEALARFENVGDLPRPVIASVLVDEALRSKLSVEKDVERRVELVKEALVQKTEKIQGELARENERVRGQLRTAEEESLRLRRIANEQTATIGQMESQQREAQRKLEEETKFRRELEERVAGLERGIQAGDARRSRLLFSVLSLAVLVLVALAPILSRQLLRPAWQGWRIEVSFWAFGLLLWTWAAGSLARRHSGLNQWPPVVYFMRFRRAFLATLGTVALGALGNAAWEWIKKLRS